MASSAPWRSRIVGHGDLAPAEITPHDLNWRRHPAQQRAALAGVLDEVGWVQDVIVNRTTGRLVDGHLRVAVALERGEPSVPVVYVELSDDEERLVLATLDPLGALAETDTDALASLLATVAPSADEVRDLVSFLARRSGIGDMDDPLAEWQGMPSFEQNDASAYRTLHMHFADEDAVQAFSRLIAQSVTENTTYLWYPKMERRALGVYVGDES